MQPTVKKIEFIYRGKTISCLYGFSYPPLTWMDSGGVQADGGNEMLFIKMP